YYERSLDIDPELQKAFEGLVECLDKAEDYAALTGAYDRQIGRIRDKATPERLAQLYDSMAEILQHRLGRPDDAISAFERAAELDPENRHRTEVLAAMYEAEPRRYFEKAIATHNHLLHLSPFRVESYRSLRNLYSEMNMPDEAFCVCQVLKVLNMAEPDEEAYVRSNRSKSPAAAQDFLTDELWAKS